MLEASEFVVSVLEEEGSEFVVMGNSLDAGIVGIAGVLAGVTGEVLRGEGA